MASASQPSRHPDEGRSQRESSSKGSQCNAVCGRNPNPKGLGLHNRPGHHHIASMLNAVENALQDGHRAWEERLHQRSRSSKFFKIELPKAWRWQWRRMLHNGEGRKSSRMAALSTRLPLQGTATSAFAPRNGSQEVRQEEVQFRATELPGFEKLLKHPLALVSFVPRELALFLAGAVAGAAAKTVTAPLDRIKLLMQVHGVRMAQEGSKRGIGLLEAITKIGNEEGIRGFWKGNVPQVVRVIPYSAVQLLAYEAYKRILTGDKEEISVVGRLAAGACAGMTSTLVTYPLDVLRLRLAVDPATKSMGQVAAMMLRDEGLKSFYKGLGPSLLGIAPYIALNFCVFDLMKKTLPEDVRKRPEASLATALISASFATAICYPLDTVRRQMQMKGTPFNNFFEAIPGIVARDGFFGLYRGFVPNVLKNLPNSSIRLTTFDAAKNLISASQAEYEKLVQEHQK